MQLFLTVQDYIVVVDFNSLGVDSKTNEYIYSEETMKLLCDGWCADYDIKLKGMPKDELKDIFKDIYKYLVLNFHDQDLDEKELLRISEVVGSVQNKTPNDANHKHGGSGDVWAAKVFYVFAEMILLKVWFFSPRRFRWHAHPTGASKKRKQLIWLYALTGTVGSSTSWLNNSWAYDDFLIQKM